MPQCFGSPHSAGQALHNSVKPEVENKQHTEVQGVYRDLLKGHINGRILKTMVSRIPLALEPECRILIFVYVASGAPSLALAPRSACRKCKSS